MTYQVFLPGRGIAVRIKRNKAWEAPTPVPGMYRVLKMGSCHWNNMDGTCCKSGEEGDHLSLPGAASFAQSHQPRIVVQEGTAELHSVLSAPSLEKLPGIWDFFGSKFQPSLPLSQGRGRGS